MFVKLLTEHHLEFLSLTGGCRGSSESTLVKMSNCWKSHATAQLCSCCHVAAISVLSLLLTEPWAGLQYVTMAFPDLTHLYHEGAYSHNDT